MALFVGGIVVVKMDNVATNYFQTQKKLTLKDPMARIFYGV